MSDFRNKLGRSINRGEQTAPLDGRKITKQLSVSDHKDRRETNYPKMFEDVTTTIRKVARRYGQESFPDEVDITQTAVDTLAKLWNEFSSQRKGSSKRKTITILNEDEAKIIEDQFSNALNRVVEVTQDGWKQIKKDTRLDIYEDIVWAHSALSKYKGGHIARFVQEKYKRIKKS